MKKEARKKPAPKEVRPRGTGLPYWRCTISPRPERGLDTRSGKVSLVDRPDEAEADGRHCFQYVKVASLSRCQTCLTGEFGRA